MTMNGERLIQKAISPYVDRIIEKVFARISEGMVLSQFRMKDAFSSYLHSALEKTLQVRTIDCPNEARSINDFYVSTRYSIGTSKYRDVSIFSMITNGQRVAISGPGGSGKSILLKYFFLTVLSQNTSEKLPVFVELRRLNFGTFDKLEDLLIETLHMPVGPGVSAFRKLSERGFFVFILDGFDEIELGRRRAAEKEILTLARKYRSCHFVISGRPSKEFMSWDGFTQIKAEKLNLSEALDVIKRSSFQESQKERICSELSREFFEESGDLLSTPLLVTMLLMTYSRANHLPKLLTHFYQRAFEVLLTWHDANKESFARETTIGIEQFRRFYSIFCLVSYIRGKVGFSETELRSIIRDSIRYSQKNDVLSDLDEAMIDGLKNDLWESSSLLILDGQEYSFIHRSMQEYFAAEAIVNYVASKRSEILEIFSRRSMDQTFSFCFELSEDLVFDEYFSRRIDWFKREYTVLNSFRKSSSLETFGLTVSVALVPFEEGKSQVDAALHNESLVSLVTALDAVSKFSEKFSDIEDLMRERFMNADFQIPKNFDLDRSVHVEIFWDFDGVAHARVVEGYEGFEGSELFEKIIPFLIARFDKVIDGFSEQFSRYVVNCVDRMLELEEMRKDRSTTLDEILQL